jgi:hypothetical protein
MLPKLDLPRALLRGRYMAAAARMEWNGVPIDTAMLAQFRAHWTKFRNERARPSGNSADAIWLNVAPGADQFAAAAAAVRNTAAVDQIARLTWRAHAEGPDHRRRGRGRQRGPAGPQSRLRGHRKDRIAIKASPWASLARQTPALSGSSSLTRAASSPSHERSRPGEDRRRLHDGRAGGPDGHRPPVSARRGLHPASRRYSRARRRQPHQCGPMTAKLCVLAIWLSIRIKLELRCR